LDSRAVELPVHGQCSDGTTRTITIQIPHPFTYLMMKLFAFDDRNRWPSCGRRMAGR
jgi:hypothetical protein